MQAITRAPIDPAQILAAVASPATGGTALFLGTVRQGPDDGPVESIEYSAYEAMVEAEWTRILAEALTRWPMGRFAAQHRVGVIALGEASIAVAAALPHRAEAFAACQWIVDEAKARLPVWKQERFAGGHVAWREGQPGVAHPRQR